MIWEFAFAGIGKASWRLLLAVGPAIILLTIGLQYGYAQNTGDKIEVDAKTQAIADKPIPAEVNVKTFGATGDGITNDTEAFAAALRSLAATGGGVCQVPAGTYIISASGITQPFIPAVSSGVHLVGKGPGRSILKINGMPTNHMLQCDGDNWSVENVAFDMQGYFPAHLVSAVTCKGSDWRVINCDFINIGRFGISVFGGKHWRIEGNNFTKTKPIGDENEAINVSFSKIGTAYATNARIVDNVCDGSGIWFFGTHSLIARNRVSRTGFGTGIGTGRAGHANALKIIGNICSEGHGFDQNRTWVSGFELWAPNSIIANNTAYGNDGTGIIVGGQNCIVIANHSYDNGVGHAGFGFGARYLDSVNNASGSVFVGNLAHDAKSRGRSLTQSYGYAEQPGGLRDIVQIANDYNGNKTGALQKNALSGSRNMFPLRWARAAEGEGLPTMKSKLKGLAAGEDVEIPSAARHALLQYLER